MRNKMKSKKAQAQANEATRKEEAAMERRQKQSQKSKENAAQAAKDKEARLAAIAAEAAKDEETRDNATPADINRETTPAHQPINRRALVEQLNAMKQAKGRVARKDKNELDHPSLTKDAKDCLRSAWLDGEVWFSDNRLCSLLCQLLGETGEQTGRKQLVAMQDWTEVASGLAS